ncbi:MAG: hypothetical protein COU31_03690 [Candidatus Magasanikbacteria bacterium CG10_big_fil_rev_8_21_14_0_10_40_10]|uniref:Uncharacterized protein n=1 Tax=Candidatus Magasanikbacteria bacterium CG10_big_fil_rev_8_21_14_0_10_40_10 TaxID=1974648 RepID=A0A2M6W3B3_9BACT|nr:MAG: hypothetical protein COU31_03690 [Candidatus Magasanikbacteria bacterium CG10_big_fil_rev_8_21_14_0_10_40_10]
MEQKRRSNNNWKKSLKLLDQCPICGQNYSSKTIKLFLEEKNAHLVHITCSACHSYFVAIILEMGRGISTLGMITDLSYDDLARLRHKQPIGLDESLEACQYIEKITSNKFSKKINNNK